MMAVLKSLLIMVEVISGLLLIGAVLIQKTRSQGMGMAFGSGMGESLFGAGVGNVLTKITVVLAIVFLANTTLLALIQSGKVEASVTEGIAPAPAAPIATPASLPQQTAPSGGGVPIETPPGEGVALLETTPAEGAAPVAKPAPEGGVPVAAPQPAAPAEAAPAEMPEPAVAP
jgi:preprotein translocase subunit SecG